MPDPARLLQAVKAAGKVSGRSIAVPGYWHEQQPLPGTGVGLYETNLRLTAGSPANCELYLLEVSSAATVLLNGKVIGRSGRVGFSRKAERPQLAPFRIPMLLAPGENRLQIIVSNHHARGGGIHGILLGNPAAIKAEYSQRLLSSGLLLGFVALAVLFFGGMYLADPTRPAYIAFVGLLLCLGLRIISAASLLEQVSPDRNWTDLRLLMEYLSGVSVTPIAFHLFMRALFPQLLLAGCDSLLERFESLWFVMAGWLVMVPGLLLTAYFIASGDASDYGRFQGLYVKGYLLPCIIMEVPVVMAAVRRKYVGARLVLLGFAALAIAAFLDVQSVIRGDVTALYVPMGTATLIAFFALAPMAQLQKSLRAARRARDRLSAANKNERRLQQERDDFVIDLSGALLGPLRELAHSAQSMIEENRRPTGGLLEQARSLLVPLERWQRWSHLGPSQSQPKRHADLKEILAVEAAALREVLSVPVNLLCTGTLPPVRLHREWFSWLFEELTPLIRASAPPRLALFATVERGLVELRIEHKNPSGKIPTPLELIVADRICQLHGSRLTVEGDAYNKTLAYSFSLSGRRSMRTLALARLQSNYDLAFFEEGSGK